MTVRRRHGPEAIGTDVKGAFLIGSQHVRAGRNPAVPLTVRSPVGRWFEIGEQHGNSRVAARPEIVIQPRPIRRSMPLCCLTML